MGRAQAPQRHGRLGAIPAGVGLALGTAGAKHGLRLFKTLAPCAR